MFRAQWMCRSSFNTFLRSNKGLLQLRNSGSTSTGNVSISPALITRARNLAAEYEKLSAQILENYDSKTAKRIGEIAPVTTALKEWESSTSTLTELHALLDDPTTDPELASLAVEDLASTNEQLQGLSRNLASSLTPVHPFASLPCLMEIRPGAGGSEANIFAGDLLRMYMALCSRLHLQPKLISYITADGTYDTNPLDEAIIEINTPNSYGLLRSESGVHRVQRVPATEAKGRTHTSAVAVMVLPSFPSKGQEGQEEWEADFNDPESDYYVNPADVRTDVMRARGAGGQHVNTTDSAVRLTHIPTKTVVSMQDSRSQHANREKAWQVLRSRLAQARREKREEEQRALRLSVVGSGKMGREHKVRTYNWGQQRVTDHRSGFSVHDLDDVMEGGEQLEKIMESVRAWMADQEVMGLIAEEEAAANENGKGKGKGK